MRRVPGRVGCLQAPTPSEGPRVTHRNRGVPRRRTADRLRAKKRRRANARDAIPGPEQQRGRRNGVPPAVRHCPAKHPLLGAVQARSEAERQRAAGAHVEAASCPDCGGWIIRAPLSLAELEALAARLRGLPNLPAADETDPLGE